MGKCSGPGLKEGWEPEVLHWPQETEQLEYQGCLLHSDETLNRAQGSQWFSSLDLRSGYWQVKMDKESKLLTTFTVGPLGFYKCDSMPFRLTNALATFQWLIETCLRDFNPNWCIIYFNDIVIFLKDPASHLKRMEAMFQKLEQARLKLKSSKCELFHRQITYLGHNVSAHGIATNEGKNRCY